MKYISFIYTFIVLLKKILKNVNNKMRFNLIIYLKIYMQNFTTKLAWENRVTPYNNFETIECIKTSNKFRVHKQYNPVITKKTKITWYRMFTMLMLLESTSSLSLIFLSFFSNKVSINWPKFLNG